MLIHRFKKRIMRLSLDAELERLRERLNQMEDRRLLLVARNGRDVCWVEDEDEEEPLVTIRIATYNRGQLVVDRAIASALAQTYQRLEILVIGDHCDEPTKKAVESVRDPRIRFYNLPMRGIYPLDSHRRWMVAGTAPMNAGLVLAEGTWIAPCDDDDELTPDHVEVLLQTARAKRLEMVWSKFLWEVNPDEWEVGGGEPLALTRVTQGALLYSLGLRFLQHSNTCWKMKEPGDWNLCKRMEAIGVRMAFHDGVTYKHYLEAHSRRL